MCLTLPVPDLIDNMSDIMPKSNHPVAAPGLSPAKVRAAIARTKYSQRELAKRLGIYQPSLARLLARENIDCYVSLAIKLANALQCTVDNLIDKDGG